MLYITKKLNKGGGVRHSTRTNWRKYSWENWWIEIAWGKDEEKTHRRHCLHKAIILYTPKKRATHFHYHMQTNIGMFLWDWHQFKGNQTIYHSPVLQSHQEPPNWGQQERHPLFLNHPPSPECPGRGRWLLSGWEMGSCHYCSLPALLTDHSYSGWKRPLSPAFDWSPPRGVCHQRTQCSTRRWKQVVSFRPHSDIIPPWKPQHPTQLVFQEFVGLSQWELVAQEGSSGWCLCGSQERSEGQALCQPEWGAAFTAAEVRISASRIEFTTWTKQFSKTSIWTTAQSHLFWSWKVQQTKGWFFRNSALWSMACSLIFFH